MPTLDALIRARRNDPSALTLIHEKRFLAVGQASAKGETELVSVGSELAIVAERIQDLATFICLDGPESSIPQVMEELRRSEWVHFACHGIPNKKQPFDSAFGLHDGRFTVERIMGCELENPESAYLSACHTTVGDEESPDEVIHLASAIQFAGFRSVIGMMWAVDDAETNKIASKFYENMLDGCGRLNHTRAALALQKTMNSLAGSIPLDQRILYVHIGA